MRKLPALDPEVQAVIDETMANWRRRNGRCPDPAGHRALHDSHEVTIRARAEGRALAEVESVCPYCDRPIGGA